MELDDLRAFARIAEMGSVSAAARSLGLPKSTVSRSLTRLEGSIGALLIDRSPRHLRLTDAGVLFKPYATRILADVDEAGTALDNFTGVPRGTLRVSAPFTFVVAIVSPMLPSFITKFPEVRIVLDVENRVIDMPVEPADLVIRVGAMPDRVGRPIRVKAHGKDRLWGQFPGIFGSIRRFLMRCRHEVPVCCVQSLRPIYIGCSNID